MQRATSLLFHSREITDLPLLSVIMDNVKVTVVLAKMLDYILISRTPSLIDTLISLIDNRFPLVTVAHGPGNLRDLFALSEHPRSSQPARQSIKERFWPRDDIHTVLYSRAVGH